jgi:sulfate/thiosulfate transport system ATP-binding protein
MSIELINITKNYGNFLAIERLNLKIQDGELLSLLGPSGSGKTTLLRMLAGLESINEGEILFHGRPLNQSKEKNIGFVFQHYALFKHMTVEENISFPLKMKKVDKKLIKKKSDELLHLVQLSGLEKRYPSQLSGGQKQRVALARALASEPKILLLDEPFGALDASVRKDLRRWLRNLHKEIEVTTVMVTHDQEEAFEVSDRVAILHKGKLQQIGTPDEIFHKPTNPFVIQFLGNVNIFHGRVESGNTLLNHDSNELSSKIFIRPHEWDISHNRKDNSDIESKIEFINAASFLVKIDLISVNGDKLHVDLTYNEFKSLDLKKNQTVFLSPKESRIFDEDYVI